MFNPVTDNYVKDCPTKISSDYTPKEKWPNEASFIWRALNRKGECSDLSLGPYRFLYAFRIGLIMLPSVTCVTHPVHGRYALIVKL